MLGVVLVVWSSAAAALSPNTMATAPKMGTERMMDCQQKLCGEGSSTRCVRDKAFVKLGESGSLTLHVRKHTTNQPRRVDCVLCHR